jgi:F-type H+-transporting ATPase subunit delta
MIQYSIARPYAKAAFEVALEKNEITQWHTCLSFAAKLTNVKEFQQILRDPRIPTAEKLQCFFDLLKDSLTEEFKKFLQLLNAYEHLFLFQEILVEFNNLRAEYEQSVRVEVISAFELSQQEKNMLIQVLEKRLKRKAEMHYYVDPALLAGVKIRVGDRVTDGSMRGRLERMKQELMN